MKGSHYKRHLWQISALASLLLIMPFSSNAIQTKTTPSHKTAVKKTSATKKSALITLSFQDISIRQLLQVLSQFAKTNFVINDNVTGNMSIHLKNVTWQEALSVILESRGLGKLIIGNTYIIAPQAQITQKKIGELQTKTKIANEQPLHNRIVFLHFANAMDIYEMLTGASNTDGETSTQKPSFLSPRGQLRANQRTNSLWIHDTLENIAALVKQIKKLDYPLRQVEIDVRIVSIDRDYERNLGARLGVTNPYSVSGSLGGANAIQGITRNVGIRGDIARQMVTLPPTGQTDIPFTDRLNFNNPASTGLFESGGTFSPGSIGLALAKLGGGNLLDLELSALEGKRKAEVLSSPKIITTNQHPATITQGSQVPFATSSPGGGTTIEQKPASLSLSVTPQITPGDHVILYLNLTNNSIGTAENTGGTSTAVTINTEEETSTVLLNNNQTIVVGGIFKETKNNQIVRIPLLGSIPIIGKLFSQTNKATYHNELLIFITPHIINKPSKLNTGALGHEET